jgi:hypothetical protein
VNDIDIHQLNLWPFKSLKFLDEIIFKKCVFFLLKKDNICIIISFFREKLLPYERRRDL